MAAKEPGGYIYVASEENAPDGIVKIGSTSDPVQRRYTLQTGCATKVTFKRIYRIGNRNCKDVEKELGERLIGKKIDLGGGTEFYQIKNSDDVNIALDNSGVEYTEIDDIKNAPRDVRICCNYQCPFCSKSFPTKNRYQRHMSAKSLCISLDPMRWSRFLIFEKSLNKDPVENPNEDPVENPDEDPDEDPYDFVNIYGSLSFVMLNKKSVSLPWLGSFKQKCIFCNEFKDHTKRKRQCIRITPERYRMYLEFE